MQSLTGSLVVTIVDAKDLNSEQFGKLDPYCKASFPGLVFRHRYRTKAHKRGGNAPIWDETHTFHLNGTRGDAKLKLSVYDRAVFRAKPIGRASLYLAELLEHRGEKTYYPLIEMDRPDFRVAGYIGLIVDFLDERKGSRLSTERRQENTQTSINSQMQSQQMQPQVTEPQLAHPQSSMDTQMHEPQNFVDNQRTEVVGLHQQSQDLHQQDLHQQDLQQQQQQQQEFQQHPQYQQFQPPIKSDLEADKSSQLHPMTQFQQPQSGVDSTSIVQH